MSKLYLIIFIDNYSYRECPPQWKVLSLTPSEYETMNDMVIDFENTRSPFFYPQMYIYPIEEHKIEDIEDIKDWISELKGEVVEWKKEQEMDREERRKYRQEKNALKNKK